MKSIRNQDLTAFNVNNLKDMLALHALKIRISVKNACRAFKMTKLKTGK